MYTFKIRKIISLGIIILIVSTTSCITKKGVKYEAGIPITKELLVNEWTVDSIYGSREFILDRICFTPKNKFWWLSDNRQSQIVDSLLSFKDNRIYKDAELRYSVVALDSANLLLTTPAGTIFHCKKYAAFDKELISGYIKSNSLKKQIVGVWKLSSSEITPAGLPSFCNDLLPGTSFVFDSTGILGIYAKGAYEKCYDYTYLVSANKIQISEGDMVMEFEIIKLAGKELIIKNRYPNYKSKVQKSRKVINEGYLMNFKKE